MQRDKGIVLVITLVILASISFMASFLYLKAHKLRKEAFVFNRLEEAEKFFPELGAGLLRVYRLYQKKYGSVPEKIEFSYQAGKTLGFGKVTIELSPEDGRCNLNEKDEERLLNCLQAAGLPPKKAQEITESVLDWTDPDDEPRPLGAEKDYYQDYKPANRPLKSLSEALLIKGINPYLFWRPGGLFEQVTIFPDQTKEEKKETEKEEGLRLIAGKAYRLKLTYQGREILKYVLIFRWGKNIKILFASLVP